MHARERDQGRGRRSVDPSRTTAKGSDSRGPDRPRPRDGALRVRLRRTLAPPGKAVRRAWHAGTSPKPQAPSLMRPSVRTTVIGSYPFPGWLELASEHLDRFGPDDRAEVQRDA